MTASEPPPTPLKEMITISLEVFKLVFTGLRAQLLARLVEAPHTVQALAKAFSLPVTRLYYHMHLLEAHGLIAVVAEHPAGGTIEKVYRATARQYLIDRAAFATPGPAALAQAKVLTDVGLREVVKEVHRSVAAGVIDLRLAPPAPQALFIRRAFGKLSAAQAAEFHTRLAALMTEFTQPGDAEDQAEGEGYTLALVFFPNQPDPNS